MKKIVSTRKLVLNPERLRNLTESQLGTVVAASGPPCVNTSMCRTK